MLQHAIILSDDSLAATLRLVGTIIRLVGTIIIEVPDLAYQYTNRERKAIKEARAYEEDLRERRRTFARLVAKAEKLSLSLPPDLSFRNIGELEFKPATFTCSNGHEVVMIPNNLLYHRAKYGCKRCAEQARGIPDEDSRAVFRRKCDEQGFELINLTTLRDKVILRDRGTGEHVEVWPQNIERWSMRPAGVYYVADDDDHVFVFRGSPPPIVKAPFVANLLKRFPVEAVESRISIGRVIAQFVAEGDKVVNISANPSFLGDNVYTWGTLPEVGHQTKSGERPQ